MQIASPFEIGHGPMVGRTVKADILVGKCAIGIAPNSSGTRQGNVFLGWHGIAASEIIVWVGTLQQFPPELWFGCTDPGTSTACYLASRPLYQQASLLLASGLASSKLACLNNLM